MKVLDLGLLVSNFMVLIKKSVVHVHPMQNEIEKFHRNRGGCLQET